MIYIDVLPRVIEKLPESNDSAFLWLLLGPLLGIAEVEGYTEKFALFVYGFRQTSNVYCRCLKHEYLCTPRTCAICSEDP